MQFSVSTQVACICHARHSKAGTNITDLRGSYGQCRGNLSIIMAQSIKILKATKLRRLFPGRRTR